MRVVIVGARTRSGAVDYDLVKAIIEDCHHHYSKVMIVTKSCDRSTGKLVKDLCVGPNNDHPPTFDMLEVSLRHILMQELPRSEFQGHFNALNDALFRLGEEFHLLTEEYPSGAMLDILIKVRNAGLPYVIYRPSEAKVAKRPIYVDKTTQGKVEEV
jgi:hypothetical protein